MTKLKDWIVFVDTDGKLVAAEDKHTSVKGTMHVIESKGFKIIAFCYLRTPKEAIEYAEVIRND